MENYSNTYFEVRYVDIGRGGQPFTNCRTFLSLSKAREFAKKMLGLEPVHIVQITTTFLETLEPNA